MHKIKKFFLLLIFLLLFTALLCYPKECISLALDGLNRWFHNIIPTLLPFMILSQLLVRLQYHTYFVKVFSPLLQPLFRINHHGIYVILVGFLCGFPTGGKTCTTLYENGSLTRHEANYLLAFTNLIGPIYFCSFVIPLFSISNPLPYLFGMYGISLLYGILLRYTIYKNKIEFTTTTWISSHSNKSFFAHLDDAIYQSLQQIAMLGGYMILFQLFNILPLVLQLESSFLSFTWNLLVEITNGLCMVAQLKQFTPFHQILSLSGITFGGFCCLAQTYHIIQNTNLSKKLYLLHKILLTIGTILYYYVIIT
ncbi:MAG: nucleoside recognition domain-containing protein [Eubacteriales bacterium]